MYRPVKEELSRDEQEDLLKKLLYQQGISYPSHIQGSNTTLLTALAQTIHTTDETLHLKLCEKLQQDYKNLSLPKKLNYIYDDPTITEDFRKYPQLINFTKIILELFSASTQRRIKVFSLVKGGQSIFYLQNRIINPGGYRESINIGKIENKYYNIKENDIQFNKELSFEDVFKSSTQIDSQQLIQTFKPEVKPQQTESVASDKDQKFQKLRFEETKPGKLIQDLQAPDLTLKKVKSSIPIYNEDKHLNHEYAVQFDKGSVGETKSLREDAQLINQCGPNREDFNNYHANVGIQGVMSPQQMYYLYYQSSYYGNKSQNYMNYTQMPIHAISPQKSLLPQTQAAQAQNYYTTNTYPSNPQAGQSSQNKRYTGRLKFFDQGRNYGFIIMDADESDIFVHYDDLQKAGISKQIIKTFKNQMYLQIRFNFKVMEYFGKYKKSRKAVQLIIMGDTLSLLSSGYPLPE